MDALSPLEQFLAALFTITGLLGSVLAIGAIGWVGKRMARWVERRVSGFIGEVADNE